jgi:hypothetical protein
MKYSILGLVLIIFSLNVSASLCGGSRLTPSNYPFKYKKIKRILKKIESRSFVERFLKLEKDESEVCAWNRFLFVDFMLYYNRFKSLRLNQSENLIETSKLRDELYEKWLVKNRAGVYSDHRQKDLRGMSFDSFLMLPSEHFGYLTKPLKILNRRPRKNKARQFVYDHLQARSPFNSIFPKKSMELLLQSETTDELKCILKNNSLAIKDKVSTCFSTEKRAIEILGVLASQRMYLVRDFTSWAKQNYDEVTFHQFYTNASLSSLLYFKLETEAHLNGTKSIYIMDSNKIKSAKPYHFYSVAYIAQKMILAGFNHEQIRKNAAFYAKKYKKSIKTIGIIHNLIAGIPLKNGSVGDKKQVLKEQLLAIDYILQKDLR